MVSARSTMSLGFSKIVSVRSTSTTTALPTTQLKLAMTTMAEHLHPEIWIVEGK